MKNTLVNIDLGRIVDWPTFHSVFARALGFPAFYGRNMNAWIDCMTYLDDSGARMISVHAGPGQVVVLQCAGVKEFASTARSSTLRWWSVLLS
jgi:hypothetical protein